MSIKIIYLAGVLSLLLYLVVVICMSKKMPPSISDTFYMSGKWMFSLLMLAESIVLTSTLLELSCPNFQIVGFITGAALGFVGAAPCFRDKHVKYVHFIGAYTFAIGSQLWVALYGHPLWLCIWLTYLPYLFYLPSYRVFIAELYCVLTLTIVIFI